MVVADGEGGLRPGEGGDGRVAGTYSRIVRVLGARLEARLSRLEKSRLPTTTFERRGFESRDLSKVLRGELLSLSGWVGGLEE